MKTRLLVLSATVALTSLTAWADNPADDATPLTKIGMDAMVGGGVTSFINTAATDVTRPGGIWTARLILGTRSHFGAEAAYLGTAQALDAIGVDQSAYLLSNGLEGSFRINALTGALQPYAVAGLAWRHYTVQNTKVNTSSVKDVDDVAEIPVGLGIAYRYAGLVADARASMNTALNSSLMGSTNLTNIHLSVKVGFEF